MNGFFKHSHYLIPVIAGIYRPFRNTAFLSVSCVASSYLRTASLKVYVIRDEDGSCLGVANVPLLPLVDDSRRSVNGLFELRRASDEKLIPVIAVAMRWVPNRSSDETVS